MWPLWLGVSRAGFVVGGCQHGSMNVILLLISLLAGALLGAAIGYLYARARLVGTAGDLTARMHAAEERARAAADRADLIDRAAQERAELADRTAAERAELIDGYLAERFQALSAQALDVSQQRLAELSEMRLRAAQSHATQELDSRKNAVEHLVAPLTQTLARVEAQLREAELARQASHSALAEQVKLATASSDQLRAQTQALVTALRRPEARGRWGEMQLRRVAELAGMAPHCDFDEQVSLASADGGTLRPDMVVHFAGNKSVVVDAKVSLAAYLEAAEATDDAVRESRLDAHARHLRDHVDRLAAKAYWAALSPAPEFVVLFIPGEAFLAPALERDPALLEYAISKRVHPATPTTLVTMLRTAQYAWQQEALADNAKAVFDLGRELYDRLGGLGGHIETVGRSLTSAVTAYNRAVGNLESRVLVSARKLSQLGVTDAELAAPRPVDAAVRPVAAPELTELTLEAAPPLTAVAGGRAPTEPIRSLGGRSR
jgi:DNA recombination protein RmuC